MSVASQFLGGGVVQSARVTGVARSNNYRIECPLGASYNEERTIVQVQNSNTISVRGWDWISSSEIRVYFSSRITVGNWVTVTVMEFAQ